jgi:isopentenyl-diphosphate delta-isomerase
VIAHSMGCLITGLAGLKNIGTIILLAGPPVAPYKRMKEYFAKRPETTIDESSVSAIKRSDGSITYVESDFWDGMKTVNPPILYKELSTKSNVTFVRAISDQVITDVDYAPIKGIQSIDYCELKGNHDFEGEDRFALIELIAKTLSEERIIIVNSDDLVIGSIPRSRVTKQNIFRVSSLFLYDENGKILLGKRASSKRNNPDKWSPIVNGTNAVGESYESNILKEIREEINIALDKVELIKVVRVIENHDHFIAFFKAVIESDLPIDFDKNEMSEIRWFTKDELYEDLHKSPESFVPGFLENIYPLCDW